jgi:hypothetical protein
MPATYRFAKPLPVVPMVLEGAEGSKNRLAWKKDLPSRAELGGRSRADRGNRKGVDALSAERFYP